MKVLITGGSGFIGSFLVKKFIQKGHVVLNLDKLSKFSQKLKIKSNKYKFKSFKFIAVPGRDYNTMKLILT